MARTKQTQRTDTGGRGLPRAVFGDAVNGMNSWGRKKSRSKKKKSRRRSFSFGFLPHRRNSFHYYDDVDTYRPPNVWHYPGPASLAPITIDDEMGHDDLDDEVLLGSLRGNIVGIRYYRGTVNNNEMVALEREPRNAYDTNAIRVLSAGGQQVGHIKRELAKPLAYIMDNKWARLEGVVPFGCSNMFSMPVDLTLWGKPEHRMLTINKLKQHGFYPTEPSTNVSLSGGPGLEMGITPAPIRTYMSPAEMKNELDKLFENLEEGDKTSTAEPAKAIITPMYTHQKQALNWMIERENGSKLPPFWEEKKGRYFNSVTVFTTDKRPQSVKGGILADDMGLGKTLEVIALILTNFKDSLPLAVPVPGKIRQSRLNKAYKKAQKLESCKAESRSMKLVKLKREKMESFIVDDSKPSHSFVRKIIKPGYFGRGSSPCGPAEDSTDSDSTDDSADDSDDYGHTVTMTKEDPEFVPKCSLSKENISPKSLRPKRGSRKPARYVYNSDSDIAESSPVKKQEKGCVSVTGEGSVPTNSDPAPVESNKNSSALLSCMEDRKSTTPAMKDGQNALSIEKVELPQLDVQRTDGSVTGSVSVDTELEAGPSVSAAKAVESSIESLGETVTNDFGPTAGPDTTKDCTTEPSGTDVSVIPTLTDSSGTDHMPSTQECKVKDTEEQALKTEPGQGEVQDLKVSADKRVKGKAASKRTPVAQTVTTSGRPKRNARKPARYVNSSDSEADTTKIGESPMKKARVSMSGKSRASVSTNVSGKGKGRGRKKTAQTVSQTEIVTKGQVGVNGKCLEGTTDKRVTDITEDHDVITKKSQTEEIKTEKKDPPAVILSDSNSANPMPTVKSQVSIMSPDKITSDQSDDLPSPGLVTVTPTPSGSKCSPVSDKISLGLSDDLPDLGLVTVTPSRNKCLPVSDDELPDLPEDISIPCNSPEPSKCGKRTGRTETKGARATLIIAPLSVISNWHNQLEEHIHENVHLEIYTYYGSSRTKDPAVISKQDVVLTTYSTLAADAKGNSPLLKVDWLRVVLDEGHAIRNPNAQQTKAICQLKAERKWILTGTPIQNSMKDLWSLVNFLQINPFTDKLWWRRTIERPLEQGEESALQRVRHLMSSIALRRTKNQKLNDKPLIELPAREVFIEHIKLSKDERDVYEAMQNEGKIIVSKYFKQGTLLHNYGEVLAILMRLRQMCCHPMLVAKAAAAVKDILDSTEASSSRGGDGLSAEMREKLISTLLMVLGSGSDEECTICLDTLKDPVITHCAHVYCHRCIEAVIKADKPKCPLCRGDIDTNKLLEVPPENLQNQTETDTGEITPDNWKSSSKVDAVINAVVTLRKEDSSIRSLVVSQFTSLLSLLEIPLSAHGFRFTRLDGTMTMKERMRAVDEFMDPSPLAPTIMLLSLKAGGVGINLTSASRVFLMDPAWNPAAEDQCFDRCHHLGQTRDVIITKFIVDDSVEVRMNELQEKKRQLMQGAFGSKKETAEQRRQNRIRDIKTLMNI